MALTLENKALLEQHMSMKAESHEWLPKVLDGHVNFFPFHPVEGGKGEVLDTVYSSLPCSILPLLERDVRPIYLVNIPLAHLPVTEQEDRLHFLLDLFQKQSFGRNEEESTHELERRFALVIGINQIISIDPEVNRSFISFIQRTRSINAFTNRIFGFFWRVQWSGLKLNSYPMQTAFTLIKALDKERAKEMQQFLEMKGGGIHPNIRSQIPFQAIREKVKSSEPSQTLMAHILRHASPEAPVYFGVMDADCRQLRTNVGLFSRMDEVIRSSDIPSVVSLGYSVPEDERPLIRLGVMLDMKVREAMTQTLPFSAYFPEPCTIFCLRAPGRNCPLNLLSFSGRGQTLENRRLIENAMGLRLFTGPVIFRAEGGVVTGTPGRMRTEATEKVESLSSGMIKQKQYLKTLRGISQSHALPKEWADNLYFGLKLRGYKCSKVTNATQQLMHLFGVYDPINRMYSQLGTYTRNSFDSVMQTYHQPLSDGLVSLRTTARAQLSTLGMSEELIQVANQVAIASGEAVFNFLQQFSS